MVTDQQEEFLIQAVLTSDVSQVSKLLSEGVNPNLRIFSDDEYWGETLLMAALELEQMEIIDLLILAGANINEGTSDTPIHVASGKGFGELVERMVELGADVNATDEDNFTPLMAAATGGHPNIARFLIRNGAKINEWSQGESALTMAASRGYIEIVQLLIENGSEGIREAIDLAISEKKKNVVNYLLDFVSHDIREQIRSRLS